MSFRCDWCDNCVEGRMFKKVTEKREKEYFHSITKYIKGEKIESSKTSKGWEIVKEKSLCEQCYNKLTEKELKAELDSWDKVNDLHE